MGDKSADEFDDGDSTVLVLERQCQVHPHERDEQRCEEENDELPNFPRHKSAIPVSNLKNETVYDFLPNVFFTNYLKEKVSYQSIKQSKRKDKVVHLYSAFSIFRCSKTLYNIYIYIYRTSCAQAQELP